MNKKETLVAVYGTLRRGFGNHRLLQNAEYKGTFNSPAIFSLYNLGGFPGLKENGDTSVVMEVYSVTDEEARRVDGLEGYHPGETPTFYDKIDIETPWGVAGVYIYVGNVREETKVESGDYYLLRFGDISREHETLIEN